MDKNKRDAAVDLAMCQVATPGPWQVTRQNGDFSGIAEGVVVGAGISDTKFITESRAALPHWIERAQAAERELPAARALLIDMRERFERSEAEVERLNNMIRGMAGSLTAWSMHLDDTNLTPQQFRELQRITKPIFEA